MVHIRHAGSMDTLCGEPGSTISLEHYRKNPSDHVLTLHICPACVRLCQA